MFAQQNQGEIQNEIVLVGPVVFRFRASSLDMGDAPTSSNNKYRIAPNKKIRASTTRGFCLALIDFNNMAFNFKTKHMNTAFWRCAVDFLIGMFIVQWSRTSQKNNTLKYL
jgi:hypothetical protein